jgi:hypothetical protein
MRGEYLAFPAYFHFFGPAFLSFSLAYRTVDEPAEMSHMKFPGWTGLPGLGRAAANIPAGTDLLTTPSSQGLQKEQLALHVDRHFPPTLLKALHGLKRCPQELGHLLLGLPKFSPESLKLFIVHVHPSFWGKQKITQSKNFYLTVYTTLCYQGKSFFILPKIRQENHFLTYPFTGRKVYSLPWKSTGWQQIEGGGPDEKIFTLFFLFPHSDLFVGSFSPARSSGK